MLCEYQTSARIVARYPPNLKWTYFFLKVNTLWEPHQRSYCSSGAAKSQMLIFPIQFSILGENHTSDRILIWEPPSLKCIHLLQNFNALWVPHQRLHYGSVSAKSKMLIFPKECQCFVSTRPALVLWIGSRQISNAYISYRIAMLCEYHTSACIVAREPPNLKCKYSQFNFNTLWQPHQR